MLQKASLIVVLVERGGLVCVVAIGITHRSCGEQRGIDMCCCDRHHSS